MGAWNLRARNQEWALTQKSNLDKHVHVNHRNIKSGGGHLHGDGCLLGMLLSVKEVSGHAG